MSGSMTNPVVYIVDDDDSVRDSLTLLLGLRGYAIRAFASGKEFLDSIGPAAEGCVLLDLRMPGMDGLAVQRRLAERNVRIPLVILTAHGDVPTVRSTLKAGAFDFLEKPIDDSALTATIEAALARDAEARTQTSRLAELRARLDRLTAREREVLDLVVRGRHNREIAADLGISSRTVEVYKARMMEKLQVQRLPDLVRMMLDLEPAPGHKNG
jgi:RNA polymerase sigma factor (sigma-70 family)